MQHQADVSLFSIRLGALRLIALALTSTARVRVPQVADPEDACAPFTFSDFSTSWVALITRNQLAHAPNCTFDVKVLLRLLERALLSLLGGRERGGCVAASRPFGTWRGGGLSCVRREHVRRFRHQGEMSALEGICIHEQLAAVVWPGHSTALRWWGWGWGFRR